MTQEGSEPVYQSQLKTKDLKYETTNREWYFVESAQPQGYHVKITKIINHEVHGKGTREHLNHEVNVSGRK